MNVMVLIHVTRPFQAVLIQMVRIHATVLKVILRNLHWFALVRNSNVKSCIPGGCTILINFTDTLPDQKSNIREIRKSN